MKCNKCSGEWAPPLEKSLIFCPFCSEPTQVHTSDMPPDNVIKALVFQHGESVLLNSNLLSFVTDRLQNKAPQLLKRMRLVINEGVPQTLYSLKSANEPERMSKISAVAFELADDYGMNIEIVYEIVNYFGNALGYESITAPHKQGNNIEIGNVIPFGEYDWRVLAVENGKALLISEKILEKRSYDVESIDTTWEQCTLRTYLNGEFYNKLGAAKSTIADTLNSNSNNPWYGTSGGNATTDKIFLLSLDEVCRYFGDMLNLDEVCRYFSDSTANLAKKGGTGSNYYIDDKNNSVRIAQDASGTDAWWWLRSPGFLNFLAADVNVGGDVSVGGSDVFSDSGGVRPALWLNLQS